MYFHRKDIHASAVFSLLEAIIVDSKYIIISDVIFKT